MKHAGAQTLRSLEPLLTRLRGLPALVERTPGSFYRKSKAFLHFHEDAAGIFADVKLDGATFERLRVTTDDERRILYARVMESLRS